MRVGGKVAIVGRERRKSRWDVLEVMGMRRIVRVQRTGVEQVWDVF